MKKLERSIRGKEGAAIIDCHLIKLVVSEGGILFSKGRNLQL